MASISQLKISFVLFNSGQIWQKSLLCEYVILEGAANFKKYQHKFLAT